MVQWIEHRLVVLAHTGSTPATFFPSLKACCGRDLLYLRTCHTEIVLCHHTQEK